MARLSQTCIILPGKCLKIQIKSIYAIHAFYFTLVILNKSDHYVGIYHNDGVKQIIRMHHQESRSVAVLVLNGAGCLVLSDGIVTDGHRLKDSDTLLKGTHHPRPKLSKCKENYTFILNLILYPTSTLPN